MTGPAPLARDGLGRSPQNHKLTIALSSGHHAMKEATARRLTLAGLVACALIACAAAESDTRFLGSSNLARIHEIDDVRQGLGDHASGPPVGKDKGELFFAS